MALFQKKPIVGTSVPLYTTGLSKSIVIVGLGNPGTEYDGTRHNIGFAALDSLCRALDGEWILKKDLSCHLASLTVSDNRVLLLKPTTFMNRSGEAVQAVLNFYKLQASQVIVAHDELDVDFGQIRTRMGGSAAGHNGIKSLIQHIGEDFGRVRIGIGPKTPPQIDSADFVLARFNESEISEMPNLIKETTALLSELAHGSSLTPETRYFIV